MTVNSINKSNNATLRSAAPVHIELGSVQGLVGSEGFGQINNNNGNNNNVNNKNNNNQEFITSTYPPSPPPSDAAQLSTESAAAAKPLTMANVSTFSSAAAAATAVGGSPFSAISTSPTTDEDDGESSEGEGDSASEISFSSDSSSSSSNAASNKDHQFLASVFGPTYLDSFSKLGVQVVLPTQDVFPVELGLKGSAVLSAPQHGTKTAYLCPTDMEKLDSQTLVDLLEIADEDLECSALVICLERNQGNDHQDETLAETLHALMYVGGSIVAPDAGVVKYDSEKYILVGLDL